MGSLFTTIRYQYQRYNKAEIQSRSAALAYHTLLAAVPVIGLIFWYLKNINISQHWVKLTKFFLLTRLNVNPDSFFFQNFNKLDLSFSIHYWGWVGLLLIFYTAWNLIDKFSRNIDSILDITLNQPRIVKSGILNPNIKHLIVMLILPLVLTLSLVITQWIRKHSWIYPLTKLGIIGPLISHPITWSVDIIALFLIYYFIPRSHVPWKQALKVALIVGPVIEITRHLLGHFSFYMVALHKIYGIFVVIPLLILWVQIAWMIILGGVLFISTPSQNDGRYNPKSDIDF